MINFLKKIIPCSKRDIILVYEKQEGILQGQKDINERLCDLEQVIKDCHIKETYERLCNLEQVLVDGQMKETLERLRNIEDEMVVRLTHIEEKEDNLMQNSGNIEDRKIRIKLFGGE
ncbi:MAG: hypothetical protein E7249_17920 [Paenibacillaceae bacterium]|nr:hypothetical protein [Paenibacillaceae bacterium]